MKSQEVATQSRHQIDNKTQWERPVLTRYGSVEKITLKGWGAADGTGLEPVGHHPSL